MTTAASLPHGDDARRDEAPFAAGRERTFPAGAYRLEAVLGRRADRVLEDDLVGEKCRPRLLIARVPVLAMALDGEPCRRRRQPRAPTRPASRRASRPEAEFDRQVRPERRVGTRAVGRQRPQPDDARAEPGETDRAARRRRTVGERPGAERRVRAAEPGADLACGPAGSSGAAPARPRRRPGSALRPARTRTSPPRSPLPIARASSYAAPPAASRGRCRASHPGSSIPNFQIGGVGHDWAG